MTNPRIFLIEDDDILAKTTEWRVRKLGFEFSGLSTSGKDAIESIARLKPDIILMDISLRGEMDGIVTADLIRKSFDIPIIFLTASMDNVTISRASKIRSKGYLVKPFNDRDLKVAIEMVLR